MHAAASAPYESSRFRVDPQSVRTHRPDAERTGDGTVPCGIQGGAAEVEAERLTVCSAAIRVHFHDRRTAAKKIDDERASAESASYGS
jgi:hypothetical protein